MYIKNVNCPHCGAEKMFDDFEEVFDTCADANSGIYIEYVAYECPNCGETFTAKLIYSLKIQKVEEC